MANTPKILQLDCYAGLSVGFATLLLSSFLSNIYSLPLNIVLLIGISNFAYGCFSFALIKSKARSLLSVTALSIANMLWGGFCLALAFIYQDSASLFGKAHIIAEAIFVGGLGFFEWVSRKHLVN